MQKRALIKRIDLFICKGWAQHIVDAVSSGHSPSASYDFNLLPRDISPDFISTVCTAAFMFWVLQLVRLALTRIGVGKEGSNNRVIEEENESRERQIPFGS